MKNIIEELKTSLEHLNNAAIFGHLQAELEKFYAEVPTAIDLARAENVASVIETDHPFDAKQIRTQARKIADLHHQKNEHLTKREVNILYGLMYSRVSWSDTPSGRFDRDVRL